MQSVWGVVHGPVSKSFTGETLGAASRAAKVGAKAATPPRVQTAFPKPGAAKTGWTPKSKSSFVSQGMPKPPTPPKPKLALKPLVAAAGGGATAGAAGGVSVNHFSKALSIRPIQNAIKGARNAKKMPSGLKLPKSYKAGNRAGQVARKKSVQIGAASAGAVAGGGALMVQREKRREASGYKFNPYE
jgi:hypothetical protein